MGLDISFNAAKAIDAGMIITVYYDDYRDLEKDGCHSCKWVELRHKFTLPEMVDGGEHFYAAIDFHSGANGDLIGVVRANGWGRVYKPLTDWLNSKNIDWFAS